MLRSTAEILSHVCDLVEWLFRFLMLAVSLLQNTLTHSRQARYCTEQLEVLSVEGAWMTFFIRYQLVKIVIFSIWSAYIPKSTDATWKSHVALSYGKVIWQSQMGPIWAHVGPTWAAQGTTWAPLDPRDHCGPGGPCKREPKHFSGTLLLK